MASGNHIVNMAQYWSCSNYSSIYMDLDFLKVGTKPASYPEQASLNE